MNINLNLKLVLFIFALILLVYLLFTLLSYEKARNNLYYIKGGCEYHRWGCCPDNMTSKLDFDGTNCFDDSNEEEDKEVEVIDKIKDEVDEKCLEKEEEFIKKRNNLWIESKSETESKSKTKSKTKSNCKKDNSNSVWN